MFLLHSCDALQQNREQVAEAYFEIRTIEVGKVLKNNSSVDFQIFGFFLHTLICFLWPLWISDWYLNIFPQKKKSAFSAACHIQNCS